MGLRGGARNGGIWAGGVVQQEPIYLLDWTTVLLSHQEDMSAGPAGHQMGSSKNTPFVWGLSPGHSSYKNEVVSIEHGLGDKPLSFIELADTGKDHNNLHVSETYCLKSVDL